MVRIKVFHSLWTSASGSELRLRDLLTIVAPPMSFRIVRRLTNTSCAAKQPCTGNSIFPASRSTRHDIYARLSSPFSPFERRQKNHEPPSCCCVYTNNLRTTKVFQPMYTHHLIQIRSKLANIFRRARLPIEYRSLLADEWNRRVHETPHAISCSSVSTT